MESNENGVAPHPENFTPTLGASLSRSLAEEKSLQEPQCRKGPHVDGAHSSSKRNAGNRHQPEALLEAVVSPVPKDIIRRFIVDDSEIGNGSAKAVSEHRGSSSTLGRTIRKNVADTAEGSPGGISDGCDDGKAANDTSNCKARSAASSHAVEEASFRQRQSFNIRIPYSDRIITLQSGPVDACSKSCASQQRSRADIELPGEPGSRLCFSFIPLKLSRCKHRDVFPESHICGQLLREVASRIQTIVSDSEHSLLLSTQGAEKLNEDEKSAVHNRSEVEKLSELYARLLLFDQHLLLPWSQWWRFQKCEGEDEHASQQLAVKPFSTLLQVVPKLRKISLLRPSITSCRVRPHMKITLDLMHLCLTSHYLFGDEDVLAQELLRMYEVYCFLNNTRSGEQLTPRLRSAIRYSEEIRQKLGFPCLSPLAAVARGQSVTPSMDEELRQAEVLINDTKRKYPERWTQWIQHLQCRRQLRLQRDGGALLFKKCEQELEMKWLQIVRLRRSRGFSQSNLEMKVVYIHSDAQSDVDTIQLEILAEAEELFYYYVDRAGKRSLLPVPEESSTGEVLENSGSPGNPDRLWPFDLTEFVEAISFKFDMQERRQPGQPLRRLLLTQTPHSVGYLQATPPAEQARRLLASSLLSSVSCKVNGRALSRRAHIPLAVPSFASSSRHLLPPWDLNPSMAAVAARAGSVPGEPQETAAHTFATVLAEPLSDISFDVELYHAGLDVPRVATTRVPIAPELSLLTRPPPIPKEEERIKDVLLPARDGGSSPVLSHPVTIYVDVPFSSTCAKDYEQDLIRPSMDEKMSRRHSHRAGHKTSRQGESADEKTAHDDNVPVDAPGGGDLPLGGTVQKSRFFPSDRATRVTQNGMRHLKPNSIQGQTNFFLLEQTELRLNATEWDQENAAAAEAEALDMAATLAAEAEAEAFIKAAMINAAAEAEREAACVQKEEEKACQHKPNHGWHDWKAFKLRGRNATQPGCTAGGNKSPGWAPVSGNDVVTAGGSEDPPPAQEGRHHRAQSPSKRRSIAEEEQLEIEQEVKLLARASVLTLCNATPGVSQMPEHSSTHHGKDQPSSSSDSIGGQGEADIAGGHKEGSPRGAHSNKKKQKKRPKAKAASDPAAQNQDKIVDEPLVPTFTTDGKHSSAPYGRAELPSPSGDSQHEIHAPRGVRYHAALSSHAVPDARDAIQSVFPTQVGLPEDFPHVRAYSSSGTLLPPPPVRVRRTVRAADSSANVPPRLEGEYNFCRQRGKESAVPPFSPFPQLPASAWMGELTKESLVLQRTGPTLHDQPKLVLFPEPDWESPPAERERPTRFCTGDGEDISVMADQWGEGIPTGSSAQVSQNVLQLPAVIHKPDQAAAQMTHEQTWRRVLRAGKKSGYEGAHASVQKFCGPWWSATRIMGNSYEGCEVAQTRRNVYEETAEMLTHTKDPSHFSGVSDENSRDWGVFLDNAEQSLHGEVCESSNSFEGCLKLKITLAPAPTESSAEALLEGLEAFTLQRHHLECKVNAEASLTTLARRLPTTPAEFRNPRLTEENDCTLYSAATAAAVPQQPDAAYRYSLELPCPPSAIAFETLCPRKLTQQLQETFLLRSRPLSACIRFTLLLTVVRGSSGTYKAAWTLNHLSAQSFVDSSFAKRLMEQWRGPIPSLDSESWALLHRVQEEPLKQHCSDSCQLKDLPDHVQREDYDDADVEVSKAPEKFVRILYSPAAHAGQLLPRDNNDA